MDYFTLQDLSEGQKGAGQQLGCCWTGQVVGDKPGLRKWIEMYSYGQYHLGWPPSCLKCSNKLISTLADLTPVCKQLQSFNECTFDEMKCNNDENNVNNTQLERLKVCNPQHQQIEKK